MNHEKQNIAIAELCGYKTGYRDPEAWHPLPDYLNSLDALAPVLAELTEDEKRICWDWIYRIVHDTVFWPDDTSENNCFKCLTSTPAQLCEAYLRTMGKWEDEK